MRQSLQRGALPRARRQFTASAHHAACTRRGSHAYHTHKMSVRNTQVYSVPGMSGGLGCDAGAWGLLTCARRGRRSRLSRCRRRRQFGKRVGGAPTLRYCCAAGVRPHIDSCPRKQAPPCSHQECSYQCPASVLWPLTLSLPWMQRVATANARVAHIQSSMSKRATRVAATAKYPGKDCTLSRPRRRSMRHADFPAHPQRFRTTKVFSMACRMPRNPSRWLLTSQPK